MVRAMCGQKIVDKSKNRLGKTQERELLLGNRFPLKMKGKDGYVRVEVNYRPVSNSKWS